MKMFGLSGMMATVFTSDGVRRSSLQILLRISSVQVAVSNRNGVALNKLLKRAICL